MISRMKRFLRAEGKWRFLCDPFVIYVRVAAHLSHRWRNEIRPYDVRCLAHYLSSCSRRFDVFENGKIITGLFAAEFSIARV